MTMGPEPIIRILWRSSRRGTSIFLYQSRFTRRAPRPIQPCRRADSGQKPKLERQPRLRSECVLRTVSAVRIHASTAVQVRTVSSRSQAPLGNASHRSSASDESGETATLARVTCATSIREEAGRTPAAEAELRGSAFPGGAWERGARGGARCAGEEVPRDGDGRISTRTRFRSAAPVLYDLSYPLPRGVDAAAK